MTGMRGGKEVEDKAPMEASCQVATGVFAAGAMREPGQWYSVDANVGREAGEVRDPRRAQAGGTDESYHWCRSQSMESKHPPSVGNALRYTKGATSGRRGRGDGCGSMGRGSQNDRVTESWNVG